MLGSSSRWGASVGGKCLGSKGATPAVTRLYGWDLDGQLDLDDLDRDLDRDLCDVRKLSLIHI